MSTKKKKRLGRGLEALLGSTEPSAGGVSQDSSTTSSGVESAPNTLPIEKMQPGEYQPRTNMDQASLEELAASIRSQGIIQPPVLVRNIPDEATLAVALIENIQRENLNPVEEAFGLKRLMDEFDLTHEAMAKSVGRSRTSKWVTHAQY